MAAVRMWHFTTRTKKSSQALKLSKGFFTTPDLLREFFS
jgi:hypothetical protein